MPKSVLNTRERKKIVDGLVAQGVTVEHGAMGRVTLKFEDGDARTVNLATGDPAGITNTRVLISRKKGLRWPLDPEPHVKRPTPRYGTPEELAVLEPKPHAYAPPVEGHGFCVECGEGAGSPIHKAAANDAAEARALGITVTFSDQVPSVGPVIKQETLGRHLYAPPPPPEALHNPPAPAPKPFGKRASVVVKKPKTQASEVLSEWIDLTPALAEQLLAHNTENRNLRAPHINALARDMARGAWQVTGDSIKIDINDRMIDGQHRCYAVIKSNVTIKALLVIGLQPEAREVIDTNAKRSAGDALKFAGEGKNLTSLAATARIALGRELGYYSSALDTSSPQLTNTEVVRWVDNHPEVHSAVDLAVKTCRTIGISTGAWGYCLWQLAQIDQDDAREFALSLSEFRTDGAGDPRTTMLNVFNRAGRQRRTIPSAEAIFYVIRTWNAWRSNAQVMRLNPSGKRADLGGGVIPKPV